MKTLIALACLLLAAAPAVAQTSPCKFLCEPTFLVEPTITFEKDATVFETVFALDLLTPIPRVGVTLEAITKPFRDENGVEIESELNLCSTACQNATGCGMSKSKGPSTMSPQVFRKTPAAGRSPSCSSFRSSKAGRRTAWGP